MGIGNTNEEYGHTRATNIEQNEYEKELWAKRVTEIPNNMTKRVDYLSRSDEQPVYIGWAAKGLAEGTNGWLLYKTEFDASDRISAVKIAYGNWTNRTTATYE